MLDADAYPHIFRAVVAATPPAGLLALRCASKSLRDTVDARLAAHILLHADGRVSSRLLPRGRLPRPLDELAEHVTVLDMQAPHVDWSRYPDDHEHHYLHGAGANGVPNGAANGDDAAAPDATPHRCRCGRSTTRPAHPLPPLPNLRTVRRWGPHTCWAPAAARRLTHYGAAVDAEGGAVPDEVVWYIHPSTAPSRYNRLDVGALGFAPDHKAAEKAVPEGKGAAPRYVIAGARTAALFDMIDGLQVQREVESADGETEEDGPPASRADHFGALLAMFWLDDEDEEGLWALVDVEGWPQFAGVGGVAGAIRERVARCCVNAGWDAGQMEGMERKLRFLSAEEYAREVGEVAALEGDDHGWRFD